MADQRLLPASVRDESTEVWIEMAERLGTLGTGCLLVYFIDNVPAGALAALADQFKVTSFEWRMATTEQHRRDLIKTAIERRRHHGTPYAIEKGMEILGLTGRVTEWFEYDGDAGYFRADIDLLTRGLDDIAQDMLERMIETYKNKRSWLERIRIWLSNHGRDYRGTATLAGEVTTVYPWRPGTLEGGGFLYIGCGYQSVETVTIYPLTN